MVYLYIAYLSPKKSVQRQVFSLNVCYVVSDDKSAAEMPPEHCFGLHITVMNSALNENETVKYTVSRK